jgi:lactoylglutathione lyase
MLYFLRKLRPSEMKIYTKFAFTIASLLLLFSACNSIDKYSPLSPRFNHVFLAVSDLDKSIAFYTKAFDLEITTRLKKLTKTSPDGEVTEIEVNMAFLKFPGQDFVFEIGERDRFVSENESANYQHVGVDVKDIEVAFERLVNAGATPLQPIVLVEAEGVSAKNAFLKGPDGETIELMEMISGEF